MFPRNLKKSVLEASSHMPVVLVNGSRQTGKSTLMKGLCNTGAAPSYITLDDLTTLSFAKSSPKSFVESLQRPVIIDEIQRAPELFLPIKQSVDQDRIPGSFFLTGSTNVLSLPKLADSLAGRMGICTLWPISQGELRGIEENFLDTIFSERELKSAAVLDIPKLISSIEYGGYPDVLKLEQEQHRATWFRSYLTTILERDVKELSNIEGLTSLPNLLSLIASRAGSLVNVADLSRSLQLPTSTLNRYLTLLEAVFMVVPLRAWSSNIGKRLIKTPKLYLNDTGMLCHLLGANIEVLEKNRVLFGSILENFVVMELTKQIGWSQCFPNIYYFRTVAGQEVDIVLESRGKIVGIEIKASSSADPGDFKGLLALKELAGSMFHRGIVLYTGTQQLSYQNNLQLVPISALWETWSNASPILFASQPPEK